MDGEVEDGEIREDDEGDDDELQIDKKEYAVVHRGRRRKPRHRRAPSRSPCVELHENLEEDDHYKRRRLAPPRDYSPPYHYLPSEPEEMGLEIPRVNIKARLGHRVPSPVAPVPKGRERKRDSRNYGSRATHLVNLSKSFPRRGSRSRSVFRKPKSNRNLQTETYETTPKARKRDSNRSLPSSSPASPSSPPTVLSLPEAESISKRGGDLNPRRMPPVPPPPIISGLSISENDSNFGFGSSATTIMLGPSTNRPSSLWMNNFLPLNCGNGRLGGGSNKESDDDIEIVSVIDGGSSSIAQYAIRNLALQQKLVVLDATSSSEGDDSDIDEELEKIANDNSEKVKTLLHTSTEPNNIPLAEEPYSPSDSISLLLSYADPPDGESIEEEDVELMELRLQALKALAAKQGLLTDTEESDQQQLPKAEETADPEHEEGLDVVMPTLPHLDLGEKIVPTVDSDLDLNKTQPEDNAFKEPDNDEHEIENENELECSLLRAKLLRDLKRGISPDIPAPETLSSENTGLAATIGVPEGRETNIEKENQMLLKVTETTSSNDTRSILVETKKNLPVTQNQITKLTVEKEQKNKQKNLSYNSGSAKPPKTRKKRNPEANSDKNPQSQVSEAPSSNATIGSLLKTTQNTTSKSHSAINSFTVLISKDGRKRKVISSSSTNVPPVNPTEDEIVTLKKKYNIVRVVKTKTSIINNASSVNPLPTTVIVSPRKKNKSEKSNFRWQKKASSSLPTPPEKSAAPARIAATIPKRRLSTSAPLPRIITPNKIVTVPLKSPSPVPVPKTSASVALVTRKLNAVSSFPPKSQLHKASNKTAKKSLPIQKIIIPVRADSSGSDSEDVETDKELNQTKDASLTKEFHSSLDQFLKAVREKASTNSGAAKPTPSPPSELIFLETSVTDVSVPGKQKKENVYSRVEAFPDTNLNTVSSVPVPIEEKEANQSDPTSLVSKQITRTKEELALRERLLKATFRKREVELKLSKTEKEFISTRQQTTGTLKAAMNVFGQLSEKKTQCVRIESHIEKLKKQLQVAERSLYIKQVESNNLTKETISKLDEAFDLRLKALSCGLQCKELGEELDVKQVYQIPTTGLIEMLDKFREVYKTVVKEEVPKGKLNFKRIQETILKSLQGTPKDPSNSKSKPSPRSSSVRTKEQQAAAVSSERTSDQQDLAKIYKVPDECYILMQEFNKEFFVERNFTPYTSILAGWTSPSTRIVQDFNAIICSKHLFGTCKTTNCSMQHIST